MRLCSITVVMVCLLGTSAWSQVPIATRWTVFVSGGYGDLAPTDARKLFDIFLEPYVQARVPISTQQLFGPALGGGGGVLYTPVRGFDIGVATMYWHSPSSMKYQDAAGTLKVLGSSDYLELCGRFEGRLDTLAGLPLKVKIQGGVARLSLEIIRELIFTDPSQALSQASVRVTEWGPCGQVTFGTSMRLGPLTTSIDIGYKFSLTRFAAVDAMTSDGEQRLIGPFRLGQAGPVGLVSFALHM